MKKLIALLTIFATLTANAQVDVTNKIVNPSFETNADEGWTNTNFSAQTNGAFTKTDGKVYMEKWVTKGSAVGDASIKQTLKNLAKGHYRLTVSAQNIQQNSATTAQTGAYIYGRIVTSKTVVTTTGDYSVEFDVTSSSTAIGFVAKSATGNWICVDNFRLTFLSTDSANVNELIVSAKAQLEKKLNDKNINALTAAISAAEEAVKAENEDLTTVANNLEDAYLEAQANTKSYTTLKNLVTKARLLDGKKMNASVYDALTKAIAEGQAAQETTDNDPDALTEALQTAYDQASASITSYNSFLTALTTANTTYDATKIGAEDYNAVITVAQTMYDNGSADDAQVAEQITILNKAKFLFLLANATEGTGAAPEVTETNHYVPTGATEALMRATYAGDNLLEKGVCWSKEHNPTVLDERTTKSFSLNGTIIHVKGLESATVYYLRPYVINRTYQVAYGDEVKIVTHPKGTCNGTWDEGAPTEAANTRCRNAINETIEYFNQWTGIKGFTLSGHYGASTPTADCSYGGWMRIGPNSGNQAIGTVIHETGHGVGVGTCSRWSDTNVHNWKWYGREANKMYSFLENKDADPYNSDFCMVGDSQHGWGSSASYDWFVNGADKDKHLEFQYIGGCVLLYGLFIDGLNPTSSYTNGIPGYTYNFDEAKKYYIMNKDTERGLNQGLLYIEGSTIRWKSMLEDNDTISANAAWYLDYNPSTGYYTFKNAETGKYLSHSSTTMGVKTISQGKSPSSTEYIQLMPDRTDVTIGKNNDFETHGFWFTWNSGGSKSMSADAYSNVLKYGKASIASFDFADTATKQQWIIISEDELAKYWDVTATEPTGINDIIQNDGESTKTVSSIYNASGIRLEQTQPGFNVIKYSDGSSKKIFVK